MKLKIFIASILLIPTAAISSEQTPHELIEEITGAILTSAKSSNKNNFRENIQEVISSTYSDRIDFLRMTRSSAGRVHFNQATQTQQETLIKEYAEYITGTLASAIFEHSDYKIKVVPTNSEISGNNIEVDLTVKDPVTGSENTVGFLLHSLDGDWKIYDLNIFDTSTLASNKSYFKDKINKDGIDGLITDLKNRNAKLK